MLGGFRRDYKNAAIYYIDRYKRWVKKLSQIMLNNLYYNINASILLAKWWDPLDYRGDNWGDALNPVLIKCLTGKRPIFAGDIINYKNKPIYTSVGSILEKCDDKNIVVWGTGFILKDGRFKIKPKQICAVRGPLTRDLVIKQGIDCPEIFGDPSLLYPKFYDPPRHTIYKLGVIPHYSDKKSKLLDLFRNNPDILIIDILGGINKVVDDICSCKYIASSALHGIIAADAYNVPSLWIQLSPLYGGNFKFIDYFQSVGREDCSPIIINQNTKLTDIYDAFYHYRIDIDLDLLLNACPFIE